jgi:putative DNA primase/helicase
MHIDFEGIASGLLASKEHRRWLPDGKLQGHEWVAKNPTRGDKRPGSFSVNENTGRWADFSTGDKGGDLVSLCAYLEGTTQGEAAKRLGGFELTPQQRWAQPVAQPPAAVEPIPEPETERAPCRLQHNSNWHNPSKRWVYRIADGTPVMVVCRYDFGPGDKTCRPWKWMNGKMVQGVIAGPRPLYGLGWALQNPSLPVLVVEGEKSADAAQHALGEDWAVVSWQGGAKAADKTDWSPLKGRTVTLWPDADEPGVKAMADVARLCGAASLLAVAVPEGVPDGWDCADTTDDEVRRLVLAASNPPADAAKPPIIEGMSEDDMARRYEEHVNGRLLYEPRRKNWWAYRDGIWTEDEGGASLAIARELVRELTADSKPSDQERYRRLAYLQHIVALATTNVGLQVDPTTFDADLMLAGVPGGMAVDLRTGIVRPATQQDRLTKTLGCEPSEAPPRRWLQFLDEATGGDADYIAYLQRMVGYCLTGSVEESALFFIYGGGGNGKSVFIMVLSAVLRAYHADSPAETFAARTQDKHTEELARLQGARLVTSSETEADRHWAESRIKLVTGEDYITGRRMRENSVTFKSQFKLIVAGNNKPKLRVVDPAMRRRFHILPFTQTPKKPDRKLTARLINTELPGILHWAIEGCLEWQRVGLDRCGVVAKETAEYLHSQDMLAQWLEECCVKGSGVSESSSALFASWEKWCEDQGERPGSNKALTEQLLKIGMLRARSAAGIRIQGVRLAKETDRALMAVREAQEEGVPF